MSKILFFYIALLISVLYSCNNTNKKISNSRNNIKNKDTTKIDYTNKETIVSKMDIDIVMEILTTSPAYLEKTKGLYDAVVKNGGTSFGITLEGSPNPKKDKALNFSKTYDFNLHETYSDHMPILARFTFNPADRQLYEYDVVGDKLNPIDFDKHLLSKFDKIYK